MAADSSVASMISSGSSCMCSMRVYLRGKRGGGSPHRLAMSLALSSCPMARAIASSSTRCPSALCRSYRLALSGASSLQCGDWSSQRSSGVRGCSRVIQTSSALAAPAARRATGACASERRRPGRRRPERAGWPGPCAA
eukprot:scaffold1309_cov117-Isochrysis_galbana.AAC.4